MGTLRSLITAAVVATVGSMACAGAASAVVTASNITTPANAENYAAFDLTLSAPYVVKGTVTGTGNVDIRCYQTQPNGATTNILLASVPTAAGAFSATADLTNGNGYGGCRLRAVPSASAPADLTPFAGPMLYSQKYYDDRLSGGPNDGTLQDFYVEIDQPQVNMDAFGIASCGICDLGAAAGDAVVRDSWEGGAAFFGLESGGDRTYARIDGHKVFFPGDLYGAAFATYPGLPGITGHHVEPAAGTNAPSIQESEAPVRCQDDALTTLSATTCTSFTSAGVRFDRTFSNILGRVWRVTDVVTSTDGAEHVLDLDYANYPGGSDVGLALEGDSASVPIGDVGEYTTSPSEQPQTIYTDYDVTLPAGAAAPVGSLTVGPGYRGLDTNSGELVTKFLRTVPAGGSVTIDQAFSGGTVEGEVRQTAKQVEDIMQPPAVEIYAPGAGAQVAGPAAVVSGSARDSVGIAGLTVDGAAVPVIGGVFSYTVGGLSPGPHTFTVVATDAAGNATTATRTATIVDRTAPVLSKFSLSAKRKGFLLTSSEAATLTVTISRRDAGRKQGKACKKPSHKLRKAKACVRLTKVGTLKASGKPGANLVTFVNKVGKKTLKAGAYQAVVVARDPAGNAATSKTVRFTVKKAKKKTKKKS